MERTPENTAAESQAKALKSDALKYDILAKVKDYYALAHRDTATFTPGQRINYAGRVFDEAEMVNLVDSALDFWLTAKNYAKEFERRLAQFLNLPYALLVNSGSSANLVAFSTLTSPLLKDRAIKRGDEVITLAAGFPTTIAPIVQFGALPVFVDVDLATANIDVTALEAALSPKTKAIFIAHTLGNPFDLAAVSSFCKKHNLWLVEDNCDALGAEFDGRLTGSFGDLATSSFYPAHHITMGEGGAVYTSNPLLKKIALSIRDWGRDCYCDGGRDNTCGARFSQQCGALPFGYDHKYVYSHFGYNLKATEMQAAIGLAQLDKLDSFIAKRRENHKILKENLCDLEDVFCLPTHLPNANPSPFGFLLTLRDSRHFSRNHITEFLEAKNIQTRNLFGGNMLLHPAFEALQNGRDYRVVGDLKNTNKIMNDAFWLGVYPRLGRSEMDFMASQIRDFVMAKKQKRGGRA